MDQIYLDNNATTRLHPEVAQAMMECYAQEQGNPASQHRWGRKARQKLENAREEAAAILGARLGGKNGDRLLFTSGGTEANNLVLRGILSARPSQIITTTIEHPSVGAVVDECTQNGQKVVRLEVDERGVVLLEQLDEHLGDATSLVTVMAGNHETGVLQPIAEIAAKCNAAASLFHSDAVQMVGKMPLDFVKLGAAAVTFSAHKFHGPVGIGGLLLRGDVSLDPIVFGGSQQMSLRPGTEPVALAVGMVHALRIWDREAGEREKQMIRLRGRFEERLLGEIQDLVINGKSAPRLPQTSNLAFLGLDRQAIVMALDMAGVACSTGSACTSGSSQPSPVITAMHAPQAVINGSVRFSLSAFTTDGEIDEAAARIIKVYQKLREVSGHRKYPSPPPHK